MNEAVDLVCHEEVVHSLNGPSPAAQHFPSGRWRDSASADLESERHIT